MTKERTRSMGRSYTMSPEALEARRKGGLAVVEKYGPEYMSIIGKRGKEKFNEKYKLIPYGTSDFAIVRRSDETIVGYLSGRSI